MGQLWLHERPTRRQWIGIGLFLAGAALYLYPVALPPGGELGLIIVAVGVVANAGSAVLGRHVNRARMADPSTVTTVTRASARWVCWAAACWLKGFHS